MVVDEAFLNTMEVLVERIVTNTRSLVVTPVAVQFANEVEDAIVEGMSTTQVPKRNPTIGWPSPIETAVLEALRRGVVPFD